MATPAAPAPPSQAGAVALTVVALICLNVVAGYLLARMSGMRGFSLPDWLLWALALAFVAAGAGAVAAWRGYIQQARDAARGAAAAGRESRSPQSSRTP